MAAIRACEEHLLKRLRELAVPYGEVTVSLTCEFQDMVPVMFRLHRQIAVEEKLR